MHRYITWNGPMPTTGQQLSTTTGTSTKTMLQLATTRQIQVISWGFSCATPPAGAAGATVELIETDVAATVTAHVAAGVQPLVPGMSASLLTLGASATGYTATAEGSTTASRVFDAQRVLGVTNLGINSVYSREFMPDERPIVAVSKFLRVRVGFGAAVDMLCWVVFEE